MARRKADKLLPPHRWCVYVEFRVNAYDSEYTLRERAFESEAQAEKRMADALEMKRLFAQAGSERIGRVWKSIIYIKK